MAHVFNTNFNKSTNIPWGRGNGWVVFSMSELLAVIPRNHKEYDFIIEFYNTLCNELIKISMETECGIN